MDKELIQQLIRKVIAIILSIITIAVHIDIIKTALQIERTPPVYLLQTYTVVLAIGIISYLVYYAISQGVDVYRIIEEHRKYMRWMERTASMKREYNKTTAELGKPLPNPIDNTIEEVERAKPRLWKDAGESTYNNPIDLKFDPLEDKAKDVLDNLKKKINV